MNSHQQRHLQVDEHFDLQGGQHEGVLAWAENKVITVAGSNSTCLLAACIRA